MSVMLGVVGVVLVVIGLTGLALTGLLLLLLLGSSIISLNSRLQTQKREALELRQAISDLQYASIGQARHW